MPTLTAIFPIFPMAVTESSCVYLIQDDRWLMLLRNRKEHDINDGKWIGIGGKKEPGETMEQCAIRETFEETGLTMHSLTMAGQVHFQQEGIDDEIITVFTSQDFSGVMHACDEGTLAWIMEKDVLSLSLWPGDRIFLTQMMEGKDLPFDLKLEYDADGNLIGIQDKRTV